MFDIPNTGTRWAAIAVTLCVAFLAGWMVIPTPHDQYQKLKLAYRLTQKNAVPLSVFQMNGSEPLMHAEEMFAGDTNGGSYEFRPLTVNDLLSNMKAHAAQSGFDGICAMNYNVPVSMCYMPRLGNERDVVLFNLMMIGFSNGTHFGKEYDLFCDEGREPYGQDRFDFAWFQWYDANAQLNWVRIHGRYTRVMQSLAWLNQGVLVCDRWSAMRQADALFDMYNYQRVNS